MSRTPEQLALDVAKTMRPSNVRGVTYGQLDAYPIILAALNEATAHQENNLANAELQVQDLQAELRKRTDRNGDLEAEAKMLRIQRDTLIHQRDQLSAENARLREEVAFYKLSATSTGSMFKVACEDRDQLRATLGVADQALRFYAQMLSAGPNTAQQALARIAEVEKGRT